MVDMWSAAALYLFLAFQSNFYEQGLKALEEKRYDAAVESLTNAVAAEPTDYGAHFNLALAYSLAGKDAEAIPEYKKTLDLKPDLYPAQLNIAILLLKQKKAADAIPYLTAAAGQKPKEFRDRSEVGCGRVRSGARAASSRQARRCRAAFQEERRSRSQIS
jgi:Flp pilus assembly protein TadD